MGEKSISSLIDYLPLDDLEKEIVELVSSGKSEEELIEALIKRFEE
tara:strand:- start:3626 stop:3763 length:138 start_codon:yes stop_codon:yes gene_type:complete